VIVNANVNASADASANANAEPAREAGHHARGRCGSDGDTPPHMFEREGVVMHVILRQTRPSALVSTRDARIKVKLI
jgi:hypothetical protein